MNQQKNFGSTAQLNQQQQQQQLRGDSSSQRQLNGNSNPNEYGSMKELQQQYQSNNQQNTLFQQTQQSSSHQQQLIGQSTGASSQRSNSNNPLASNNNAVSNNNNQQQKNVDKQANPSQGQSNANQDSGAINGNNYKVVKTFQKGGSGNGSATNFSSQNTTQSSRKKGSINNQQSQSQSQQQSAAAQEVALIRESCIFCQKFTAYHSFGPLLNKALYSKYSSSQNYFYSKDINDVLANASTQLVIRFRDMETYDEEEEFLKRFYQKNQQPMKMRDLTEYYKYHKDIPRLFMVSIGNVMNRYHDKRRRIEYQRIKKQLNFETSNNNNTEDSQMNTEEEDSQGNKTSKKKEIPKECSNMLMELDVTLSFHQRMEVKMKSKNSLANDNQASNSHIQAEYSGMNAFYVNQQPNKVYLQHQNRRQSNQFDMSSMMKKASNNNFFPAQAAAGGMTNNVYQPKIQYNYYNPGFNNNENETSYQLSKILQSFQQNGAEKYFYSTEMSMSNLNSILHTQTNDISNLSNIIPPSTKNNQQQQQPQSQRIQLNYNSNINKIIPNLNFTKNKNPTSGLQTPNEEFLSSVPSSNKQKGDNPLLNQKYQNILNQQSSSSGSSNFTGNSQQLLQGLNSHPFQEIHSNLPSQKLSNIILEQQNKMQKAILNNGMQISSNNIDNSQKQSAMQLPSQQKLQQNISSSQSSSNSLVKSNQLNLNFNKQPSSGSNHMLGGKEGISIEKQSSSSSSNSIQQKQMISAKQIMKVLTQNQQSNNNNTAANTPGGTVATSPQSSLVEKDAKQIALQNQQIQILEQLKVNPNNANTNNQSNSNSNNNNNNQGTARMNSNQSISQKILQKRGSDNIYSSASINPIISYSTRVPSTQKNSSLIGAVNIAAQQLPFSSSNVNSVNNNSNSGNNTHTMKKMEIDTGKQQQQIERRYQTTERERIFSERKELTDKLSFNNITTINKQSEKQSPTLKHPQSNLLSTQPTSNQIMQIMSQRQSKDQIFQQKQQPIDIQQFKQVQVSNSNTPASAANTSRPRSSLHQNSAVQSVAASASKSSKSQSISTNPLFQTLRQSNLASAMNGGSMNQNSNNLQSSNKCDSIPSSNALNYQSVQQQQQQQQQILSNTLQFLSSQNSQNNLHHSQLQIISDGSISPQMVFQSQQSQLHLNDLQSHYHYSSPLNGNSDKLGASNNNGDLRIKKRKEGQTSLNIKGNSATGISGLGANNSNINFSQINQPNTSQISPLVQQQQTSQQQLQSQRNNLKSQNSSQKKIKHSQHQAPQLDLQQQIQGQMINNNSNQMSSVPTSAQSSAQISQSNFFNQKRNSQITQLNPDLIKTQFYKTSSNSNNNNQQKNRSSSNPKQTKLPNNINSNNNMNNLNSNNLNTQLNAPKNQNFILQYDANFSNPIMLQPQMQQHLGQTQIQQQQQQQLSHHQQQQFLLQQQQLAIGKHQKSNSTLIQPNNQFYKQSSVSTHQNFNPSSSNTSSQPNLHAGLNQLPLNLNLQLNQLPGNLQSQPSSAKLINNNSNVNNLSNNLSGNNSQNNFTQINLQLIKNYNTGNTNIISQNNQNVNEMSGNLNIGTPIYQQNVQGMQHSRTRSQELITNQMNIIGSNTTRNHNDNLSGITGANNNGPLYNNTGNNLPGGVSQINQIYEHKYHYNQPQSVRNKIERTTSTHFSDSIKRLIEQNTISSSSTTTNRTGSMISAQQFISSKQKSQIQSNQNLTNNSSKYYNQNLTNSPVSIRKSIINNGNVNNNNNNNNNNNQINLKKQNRADTFAARVSNMINIFDPSQQNSQQVLNNLHNNSGGGSINSNNLNSTNSMQQQQQAQIVTNSNYNTQNNSNHNSVQHPLIYGNQQSNSTNSNYPPSARINLNVKNSANNSHLSSLSRNNSPSKQKPGQEMNIQQNPIIGNSSPQLINSGSTGVLPLNYQVPQNFIQSQSQVSSNQNQSQQNNNSSRAASSQRGATKASQLIRYRQNNQ